MKKDNQDIAQQSAKSKNKGSSSNLFWIISIILLFLSFILYIKVSSNRIKRIDYINDENNFTISRWRFTLDISSIEEFNFSQINPKSEYVDVPHTWNNLDGQDGGSNYLRTISAYQTLFELNETILLNKKRVFIEFGAVNSVATIYLNGHYIGNHVGGFQIFRFDLTDHIQNGTNILTVFADNRPSKLFYPQFADFTFFGGIYRPVKLIFKSTEAHFDLSDYGSQGIYITPTIIGEHKGIINIRSLLKIYNNKIDNACSFKYNIFDNNGKLIKHETTKLSDFNISLDHIIQWNGTSNPYLYSLEALIIRTDSDQKDIIIDKSDRIKFGFRQIICNQSGFYLNGHRMKLNGVSRHQDRLNKGWAVSPSDEIEDINLITEVGANSVRFAHYQQSQNMFDLCDEKGLIVWVEIPFISMFLNTTESNQNLHQILTEMIKQNYNHPSVSMWGLMNEIGIGGESPELLGVIKSLNSLSKKLDPTRMTTSAIFQGTPYNSSLNNITDIFGYNLYYGWYSGTVNDNDQIIDQIHLVPSNPPLSITEYGAECNTLIHSEVPKQNDYSEEYQLYYHSKVYSIIESKNFLWGSFVWNMFDFAADSRNEGGVQGRNNKGLVTYDRKVKKDAFYFYKAKWNSPSNSPFIHICSKRFFERNRDEINISIISNLKSLKIYMNDDQLVKSFDGSFDVIETVEVKLKNGINHIKAVSGEIVDFAKFKKVKKENSSYKLPEIDEDKNEEAFSHPDGFLSVYDTVGEVMKNEEAANLIKKFYGKPIPTSALMIVKSMKIIRVIRMAGASVFPPERIKEINDQLNKMPKKKK